MPASALVAAALVLGVTPPAATHFDTQIVPILTKAGCNAGACHGAAAGRGGLHLSLWGSDPGHDYRAIVQQYEGRRVNLVDAQRSLIWGKPTGQLDHGGEVPLPADSLGGQWLLQWIAHGAPRGAARRLDRLVVEPAHGTIVPPGERVSLRATAHFAGEPPLDVTAWTVFTTTDPSALEIVDGTFEASGNSEDVSVTVLRPGQHVIIARYLEVVLPIQLTSPRGDADVDYAAIPRRNTIDDYVLDRLEKLRLPVAPPAGDATYLRRVYLDLTGTLPTADQVRVYLADETAGDQSMGKRARVVDALLESPAFVDYWTLRLARLLRVHSLPNEPAAFQAYTEWLRGAIRDGVPWDHLARELLTATGDSHEVGPANFARMVPDARKHAELVSHVFMGARLRCANCHDHPLDRWTQDDYHGLAAVFARTERGRQVQLTGRGGVTHPRTGDPAVPRLPGTRDLEEHADGRAAVADWLLDPSEPRFARAMVNRLWAAMFGRGLIDPTDDLRETNPATHPELLDYLTQDFVDHKYDPRHTLRAIALSATYARGSDAATENAGDPRFYSHAVYRPLEPEVLADALAQVTGVRDHYAERPGVTRAVQVLDPLTPAPALDILGRCQRGEDCEITSSGGGLAARLHLINGALINAKISASESHLQQAIAAGRTHQDLVAEYYLRALGRLPQGDERGYWEQTLGGVAAEQRKHALEDFVWALLNSREFTHNH